MPPIELPDTPPTPAPQPQQQQSEVKVSVTPVHSGFSINTPEGQQWMYLGLLFASLVMIQYFPTVREQGVWLFGAASGTLFAKAKQS